MGQDELTTRMLAKPMFLRSDHHAEKRHHANARLIDTLNVEQLDYGLRHDATNVTRAAVAGAGAPVLHDLRRCSNGK